MDQMFGFTQTTTTTMGFVGPQAPQMPAAAGQASCRCGSPQQSAFPQAAAFSQASAFDPTGGLGMMNPSAMMNPAAGMNGMDAMNAQMGQMMQMNQMMLQMMEMLLMLMMNGGAAGAAGASGGTSPSALGGADASGGSAPSGGTSSGAPIGAGGMPGGTDTGKKLAGLARAEATNGDSQGGWCFRDASRALSKVGIETHGASAYMAADQLAQNPKVKEIKVPASDLPKLPPGAIVVWNKGAGHEHGHISIALGNGEEASDLLRKQMTNYGTSFRVFMPV